jgi:hypothetical protein
LAVSPARDALARAEAEKAHADRALADARGRLTTLADHLANARRDLDRATTAHSAAEKALADRRTAVAPAIARARALQTEVEALIGEKKRFAPGRGGLTSASLSHP